MTSAAWEAIPGRMRLRSTRSIFLHIVLSAISVIFSHATNAATSSSYCLRHETQRSCFDLALDIQAEALTPVLAPIGLRALVWSAKDGGYIGTSNGPVWNATVVLQPVGGALALTVTIRYGVTATVEREALQIRLSGAARAIGRDLTFAALNSTLRVDRGTPVVISASDLTVIGGPGFIAARYQPAAKRNKTPQTDVQLILDDRAAHPFSIYPRCLDKLSTPEGNWLGLEQHRVAKDRLTRVAGATVQAQAMLYLTDPVSSPLPLIVERWEAGAKAAFVVTDHADRTDPQALRAILYGTSDQTAPEYGKGGFFGYGLKLTKTFFASGKRGTLDDDPEIRALAKEIVAAGSEVGSHSISARKDPRPAVEKGLASFTPWQTVTWIDHQSYTNCEALSNLGWETSGEYGIGDLLIAQGYRWLWAASDFNHWGLQLGNLFGGDPAMAMPVLCPFPPDPRLWIFRSQWFYAPPRKLAAAMSENALLKLEEQRGIFVGHTYLAASAATTRDSAHRRALAVRPTPTGALVVDSALNEALARISARVRAGTLASLTWRDAGDRLRALADVDVRYLPDGTALIENRGATDLVNLTVAIPVSQAEFTVQGASVSGTRQEANRSTVWFSLRKGGRVKLSVSAEGKRKPFLPIKIATVEAL